MLLAQCSDCIKGASKDAESPSNQFYVDSMCVCECGGGVKMLIGLKGTLSPEFLLAPIFGALLRIRSKRQICSDYDPIFAIFV